MLSDEILTVPYLKQQYRKLVRTQEHYLSCYVSTYNIVVGLLGFRQRKEWAISTISTVNTALRDLGNEDTLNSVKQFDLWVRWLNFTLQYPIRSRPDWFEDLFHLLTSIRSQIMLRVEAKNRWRVMSLRPAVTSEDVRQVILKELNNCM